MKSNNNNNNNKDSKDNKDIKFFHIRKYNNNSHNHNSISNGGLTIAWYINNGAIVYSVAICSDKDDFNKKVGREIATRRLISDQKLIEHDVVLTYIYTIHFDGINKRVAELIKDNLTTSDLSLVKIKEIIINDIVN
jgi:hypothetical protein